jgi:hypothetical protein
MNSMVLWRRLSTTDFRAMNGNASPHGRGGGAMHIALGVRTDHFPIDNFLNAAGRTEVTISAATDGTHGQTANLAFSGNPSRRGGEWRIRDQYSHRHPAWAKTAGFPSKYDPSNPPYILVFKIGKSFHARFLLESDILKLSPSGRPKGILSTHTGIAAASSECVAALEIPSISRLDEFQIQQEESHPEPFDPKNISDGRTRIIGSIIRRLGQQSFRRKLISAYNARCVLTRCKTIWVLEAAHITPYRGVRTNAVANGLLLRADVHTLFDLALISIEPSKFVARVSTLLEGSHYEELDGRQPTLPKKLAHHPSAAALEYHYRLFRP